ncbi:MAG: glucose-6-phosphate dehydrogenase [Candidatus Saccharimonadales bacterium]
MDKPPVLVIFGITGDLSKRKLLPALYRLLNQGLLPEETRIIGVSRRQLDIDQLLGSTELCVLEKDNVCDPNGIAKLRNSLTSFELQPDKPEDYSRLRAELENLDSPKRLFYMSIPPDAYAPIVENLAAAGLNDENSQLLVEKPFGYDLDSAKQLIEVVDSHFREAQVYRIDHYLARETAQNLLSFRSHNPLFSPLWNCEHIESVHIKAYESLGIEGRADFYEKTGALRDLIQSHLMQLLAITLMDIPRDLSSEQIHRSKQYFLEQLQPADPTQAVRGQYVSYRSEVKNPKSNVETYAKIMVHHSAERWQETEMILETGKSLDHKATEIIITFRTPAGHPSNHLTFMIQPHEGIRLGLLIKQPGFDTGMLPTDLSLDYDSSFADDQHIDAYERVLMDAVRADQSLFASAGEVMATWRVLQPLLDSWHDNDTGLVGYQSGAAAETIGV